MTFDLCNILLRGCTGTSRVHRVCVCKEVTVCSVLEEIILLNTCMTTARYTEGTVTTL